MPSEPLRLRRLVMKGGFTPKGCNDYVFYHKPDLVADSVLVARFWPAHYCPVLDVWIADGPGEQWKDGEIIDHIPLVPK